MSECRNFMCPVSEAACIRAECKQGFCIVEKEASRLAERKSAEYWQELSKADVDREMHRITKAAVKIVCQKRGTRLNAAVMRRECYKLLHRKHAQIAEFARRNLRDSPESAERTNRYIAARPEEAAP